MLFKEEQSGRSDKWRVTSDGSESWLRDNTEGTVTSYFLAGISSYILRKIFHEPSDCFFQTSRSLPWKWICFSFLVASPSKTEAAMAMSPANWKLFQSLFSVNGTKSGLAKSFL